MARLNCLSINGTDIAWVEWGRQCDPVLLLSHATGLHGRCWDEVVAHLDGYRVIAPDHRGHGRSGNEPPFGWEQFGADLTQLAVELDLHDIVGIGHSMGGHCMVQAAASEPDRFRELVLFDPVIFDPSLYVTRPELPQQHPVAKRRNVWESPQQMLNEFQKREPFSRWHPDALGSYCLHGLVPGADAYTLACPPKVEAGIYLSAMNFDIHDRIGRVGIPVTVVRAESRGFQAALSDFSASPTWPELAGCFAQGRDVYIPEFSHFLPLEDPALAASLIRA